MSNELPFFFPPTYQSARSAFLAACQSAGATLCRIDVKPRAAHSGVALTTDVMWLGDEYAQNVVVACSGTHGVEGPFGSACQVAFLRQLNQATTLRSGEAILFVHAVNPWGFENTHYNDEHNHNLNECFEVGEDEASQMPECLSQLFNKPFSTSDDFWEAISEEKGAQGRSDWSEFFEANKFRKRQKSHEFAPSAVSPKSDVLRRLNAICEWRLKGRDRLVIVDFHAGEGKTLSAIEHHIQHPSGSPQGDLARNHFAKPLQKNLRVWDPNIDQDGRRVARSLRHYLGKVAQPKEGFVAVIAEMSTESSKQGLELICKRIWTQNMLNRANNSLEGSDIEEVKRKLRERFCPSSELWQRAAVVSGLRSLNAAFACLRDSSWKDG